MKELAKKIRKAHKRLDEEGWIREPEELAEWEEKGEDGEAPFVLQNLVDENIELIISALENCEKKPENPIAPDLPSCDACFNYTRQDDLNEITGPEGRVENYCDNCYSNNKLIKG